MKAKNLIIIPTTLVFLTLISGTMLSSTIIKADGNDSIVDELSITVNSACTLKGGADGTETSGSSTYTTTLNAGNYTELPGSKLVTICNDNAGYSLYAIGYSGDSYDTNNTKLINSTSPEYSINTGTSGDNSYWAMKLQGVEGTTPPTILNSFGNYHVIPATYTQIAKYESTTATPSDEGASIQTKYKINLARNQMAGTYNGKVKYTMIHPNTAPRPEPEIPAGYENSPKHIEIVTPPTKTTYQDGESIDTSGMIVKVFFEDGTEWMTVPNEDITLSVDQARIVQTGAEKWATISDTSRLKDTTISELPIPCANIEDITFTGLYNSGREGDPTFMHDLQSTYPVYSFVEKGTAYAVSKGFFSGKTYTYNKYGNYSTNRSSNSFNVFDEDVYWSNVNSANSPSDYSYSIRSLTNKSDISEIGYVILYGEIFGFQMINMNWTTQSGETMVAQYSIKVEK